MASEIQNKEMNSEDILKEYDKDSSGRRLIGKKKLLLDIVFVSYSLYVVISALVMKSATLYTKLPVFLGFSLLVGFLKYPASKKAAQKDDFLPWYDIALGFASLGLYSMYAIRQKNIIMMGGRIGKLEIILGLICLLLLVEVARRAVGIPILCVAGAFLIYAIIWRYEVNPRTVLSTLIYELFYNLNCGVFSSPITVCASFIILFIILGSFLEKTGIGAFFVDLANSLVGSTVGGPAKVAVIASALTGMYSGSSVANTVSSGSVTIPMMKKTGYKPEFAAAVEAAASTGGQIMPPIMGAAAFLMAEITGYSYFKIVIAAILPACLYFTGIFLMVHFEAKRLGLKGLPKDAVPNFAKLIASNGYLLLPVVILVIFMNFYTAGLSAAMAIFSAIVVSLVDKKAVKALLKGKLEKKQIPAIIAPIVPVVSLLLLFGLPSVQMGTSIFVSMIVAFLCSYFGGEGCIKPTTIVDGLYSGTNSSVGVVAACGMAGIISGVVSMTALGSTLINVIVPLASKGPLIALFLTMLCCIVLGMGVPTTATYVIMATITAPILVNVGITTLAANMFVFYFGIVADITPPVALAAYAGAAIAHSDPFKTGIISVKLAIAAFIIPYLFSLNPDMLIIGSSNPWVVVQIIITSFIGLYGISTGFEGYALKHAGVIERILLLGGGLSLIYPGTRTDIVGTVLVVSVLLYQKFIKKDKAVAA